MTKEYLETSRSTAVLVRDGQQYNSSSQSSFRKQTQYDTYKREEYIDILADKGYLIPVKLYISLETSHRRLFNLHFKNKTVPVPPAMNVIWLMDAQFEGARRERIPVYIKCHGKLESLKLRVDERQESAADDSVELMLDICSKTGISGIFTQTSPARRLRTSAFSYHDLVLGVKIDSEVKFVLRPKWTFGHYFDQFRLAFLERPISEWFRQIKVIQR